MKNTREESIKIVRQTAGEIIFSAKEDFEQVLYDTRQRGFDGINAALEHFKAALQKSYQSLKSDQNKRNNLQIDERMMEDIRKLLEDSYFYEMEKLLN